MFSSFFLFSNIRMEIGNTHIFYEWWTSHCVYLFIPFMPVTKPPVWMKCNGIFGLLPSWSTAFFHKLLNFNSSALCWNEFIQQMNEYSVILQRDKAHLILLCFATFRMHARNWTNSIQTIMYSASARVFCFLFCGREGLCDALAKKLLIALLRTIANDCSK